MNTDRFCCESTSILTPRVVCLNQAPRNSASYGQGLVAPETGCDRFLLFPWKVLFFHISQLLNADDFSSFLLFGKSLVVFFLACLKAVECEPQIKCSLLFGGVGWWTLSRGGGGDCND